MIPCEIFWRIHLDSIRFISLLVIFSGRVDGREYAL